MSLINKLYMRLAAILLLMIFYCQADECLCEFPKHVNDKAVLETPIKPLCGKRFRAEDTDHGYSFSVGICTTAELSPSPTMEKASVVQVSTGVATGTDLRKFQLGSLEKTEIMTGTNWILLEYEGGGEYHRSCSSELKRVVIMITCNPALPEGKMVYIEENNNKTHDCYYLFELEHSAVCLPVEKLKYLSVGSLVCIFLACGAGIYLIGGILFMRLCRNAKGLHQLPNYSFWRDFGALQADGCDLVCRCGSRPFDTKALYHGIGDRQIECAADTAEEYDEHLLPM